MLNRTECQKNFSQSVERGRSRQGKKNTSGEFPFPLLSSYCNSFQPRFYQSILLSLIILHPCLSSLYLASAFLSNAFQTLKLPEFTNNVLLTLFIPILLAITAALYTVDILLFKICCSRVRDTALPSSLSQSLDIRRWGCPGVSSTYSFFFS